MTTTSGSKPGITIPSYINWRKAGFVPPVMNQRNYDCCWAIGGNSVVESQLQIQYELPNMVLLAVQELIDWYYVVYPNENIDEDGDSECPKGTIPKALKYIKEQGIGAASAYPFVGRRGNEDERLAVPRAARIESYVKIPRHDETGLLEALSKFPVAAVLDVYRSIRTYKKGTCYSKPIDEKEPIDHHCVLVVGFATSPRGKKYYLVQSSWGTEWGDDGYAVVTKEVLGNCYYATGVSFNQEN